MEERRKYIRIDKALSLSYEILESFLRPSCRSKDISEGGIRLRIFQRLAPGTALKLWIYLRDFEQPILAVGEVAWLQKQNDKEYPFEVGIRFIEINSSDRDKLSKYIISFSQDGGPLQNQAD